MTVCDAFTPTTDAPFKKAHLRHATMLWNDGIGFPSVVTRIDAGRSTWFLCQIDL